MQRRKLKIAALPLLSSLGSYFTPDDGFRHAIVSTPSGQISEVAFNPKDEWRRDNHIRGFFCEIRFLTAFYTADDKLQHPVVVTATGDIFFISYKAGSYRVSGSLARFLNMVALAGFYAGDDHKRILIVGTGEGAIHEVYFDSNFQVAITEPALATLPGLTPQLAAFYSDDDQTRHVIAATANGDVTEIWYSSKLGVHITAPPLANFKNIVSIAAFYAADQKMRTVIVATRRRRDP